VKYRRTECLSHKLTEELLMRKWKYFGLPIHLFDLVLCVSFLIALTIIIVTYPICNYDEDFKKDNSSLCFKYLNSDYFFYVRRIYT